MADGRQFSKIEPHLPPYKRGKERVYDLRVISGFVHVLKSCGRGVNAPPDYGPRKTLYNRLVRWAEKAFGPRSSGSWRVLPSWKPLLKKVAPAAGQRVV
jgi:transposase